MYQKLMKLLCKHSQLAIPNLITPSTTSIHLLSRLLVGINRSMVFIVLSLESVCIRHSYIHFHYPFPYMQIWTPTPIYPSVSPPINASEVLFFPTFPSLLLLKLPYISFKKSSCFIVLRHWISIEMG